MSEVLDLDSLQSMTQIEFDYCINGFNSEVLKLVMRKESCRLRTFSTDKWKYGQMADSGYLLAQNSLFYKSVGDFISCSFCCFTLPNATSTVSCYPINLHLVSNPDCSFVTRPSSCGNHPIEPSLYRKDLKLMTIFPVDCSDINQQDNATVPAEIMNTLGVQTPNTFASEFAVYFDRLKTFTNCKNQVVVALVKKLLDSGFFYVGDGRNDQVCCFACGVIISKWSISDDPSKKHATWKPECDTILNLGVPKLPKALLSRRSVIKLFHQIGYEKDQILDVINRESRSIDFLGTKTILETTFPQNGIVKNYGGQQKGKCHMRGCTDTGEHVGLPCGHLIFCDTCYRRVTALEKVEICPKCGDKLNGVMRAYLA